MYNKIMFFTKTQLSEFIISLKTNKDTPLFTTVAHTPPNSPQVHYLVCQLNFTQFFSSLSALITTADENFVAEATEYGEILMCQYSHRLKNMTYETNSPFYILKERFDLFISDILYPLLKILKERKRHTWQVLPQKWGLWRIFAENEKMPIGAEISLNFKTGKNWLRM